MGAQSYFHRFHIGLLVLLIALPPGVFAACPGSSSYATVQSLQAATGGGYYVSLDVTPNPSGIDVCSCRQSGSSSLYLYKSENPASDSTKTMMALAMWAKSMNKKIGYYATGCYNNTPGSGYAYFSNIWTEP